MKKEYHYEDAGKRDAIEQIQDSAREIVSVCGDIPITCFAETVKKKKEEPRKDPVRCSSGVRFR